MEELGLGLGLGMERSVEGAEKGWFGLGMIGARVEVGWMS